MLDVVLACCAVLALLAAATPAAADGSAATAYNNGSSAGSSATSDVQRGPSRGNRWTAQSARSSGSPSSTATPQCTGNHWGDISSKPIGGGSGDVHYEAVNAEDAAFEEKLSPHPSGSGGWYHQFCGPGQKYYAGIRWLPSGTGGTPAQPQVSPLALAQAAKASIHPAAPEISLNPSVGQEQLVGLTTWLWITNWQPASATATAGPVTSTVTAAPKEVIWHMGDGQAVICSGPGRPYAPGATASCAYTYRRSSARQKGGSYSVKATLVWTVTWTASGAPGGGDLGTIQRTSAPIAVRVAEAQAVNNG